MLVYIGQPDADERRLGASAGDAKDRKQTKLFPVSSGGGSVGCILSSHYQREFMLLCFYRLFAEVDTEFRGRVDAESLGR